MPLTRLSYNLNKTPPLKISFVDVIRRFSCFFFIMQDQIELFFGTEIILTYNSYRIYHLISRKQPDEKVTPVRNVARLRNLQKFKHIEYTCTCNGEPTTCSFYWKVKLYWCHSVLNNNLLRLRVETAKEVKSSWHWNAWNA